MILRSLIYNPRVFEVGYTSVILHFRHKYRMSWTYLDLLYRLSRRVGGDDYPDIRLAVA